MVYLQVEESTKLEMPSILRRRQEGSSFNESAVMSFLRNSALNIGAGIESCALKPSTKMAATASTSFDSHIQSTARHLIASITTRPEPSTICLTPSLLNSTIAETFR